MNRKQIAQNQKIVTGFFTLCFFVALWMMRQELEVLIPLILFHAILLINTYFSIECFGPMTPSNAPGQVVIETILVLLYAIAPFTIAFPSIYILLMAVLFSVAAFKYVLLLGVISDLVLLRRKIMIDLYGVFWNFIILFAGGFSLVSIQLLLWIWVLVFAGMNVYLLRIKPMYCLTSP